MVINSIEDALSVIGDAAEDHQSRDEARQYLVHLDPEVEIPQLITALASDNFTIRWEAAEILSEIGYPALKWILQALVDPEKVGNSRIREGVYHVLRNSKDPRVRQLTANLRKNLFGFLADLRTLYEAHRLLQEISDRGKGDLVE